MSDNLSKNIWLVGAGQMAVDYHNVLNDLKVPFTVVGRGIESATSFTEKTGVRPFTGGLSSFLSKGPEPCSHAIVAVSVEKLAEITKELLGYGIKNILVEKPAGLNKEEIINKAKKINTYKISIEPYEDCCSFFVPAHPETKARLNDINNIDDKLDIKKVYKNIITNIEIQKFKYDSKIN